MTVCECRESKKISATLYAIHADSHPVRDVGKAAQDRYLPGGGW